MNPKKTIKKKRFLKEETTLDLAKLLEEEELDWAAEFDSMDTDLDGKIEPFLFGNLIFRIPFL